MFFFLVRLFSLQHVECGLLQDLSHAKLSILDFFSIPHSLQPLKKRQGQALFVADYGAE